MKFSTLSRKSFILKRKFFFLFKFLLDVVWSCCCGVFFLVFCFFNDGYLSDMCSQAGSHVKLRGIHGRKTLRNFLVYLWCPPLLGRTLWTMGRFMCHMCHRIWHMCFTTTTSATVTSVSGGEEGKTRVIRVSIGRLTLRCFICNTLPKITGEHALTPVLNLLSVSCWLFCSKKAAGLIPTLRPTVLEFACPPCACACGPKCKCECGWLCWSRAMTHRQLWR